MAVVPALGAALLYAVASVLQQREAVRQPAHVSLRFGLLVRLVARPLWLAGNLADVAGYALQFLALRHGSLILVQPLLVTGLVFAVPLEAVAERRPIPARSTAGAVVVAAGLALFLVVAGPGSPRGHASPLSWSAVMAGCLGTAALLVLLSARARPAARAALLGAGAGVLFGLTAALTEATGHALRHGVVHVFSGWQVYALLAVGALNLVLAQTAFQGGPLGWSLPALTVVDPLAGIAIATFAFGEHVGSSPAAIALEAVGMAAMAAGVWVVARTSHVPAGSVGPFPTAAPGPPDGGAR
jgi:hypothetical protein